MELTWYSQVSDSFDAVLRWPANPSSAQDPPRERAPQRQQELAGAYGGPGSRTSDYSDDDRSTEEWDGSEVGPSPVSLRWLWLIEPVLTSEPTLVDQCKTRRRSGLSRSGSCATLAVHVGPRRFAVAKPTAPCSSRLVAPSPVALPSRLRTPASAAARLPSTAPA